MRRPTPLDLLALVVITTAIVLLVCFGHMSAESIAIIGGAMASLYAAWKGAADNKKS